MLSHSRLHAFRKAMRILCFAVSHLSTKVDFDSKACNTVTFPYDCYFPVFKGLRQIVGCESPEKEFIWIPSVPSQQAVD